MRVTSAPASNWIWSPRRDLAIFGGAAAVGLGVGLGARPAGDGELPEWAWLVFVLGLDVMHVWTTLFRTYLDREEFAKRRGLYLGAPVVAYVVGAALHFVSAVWFWRVLAYGAVFHFVRQQQGWVAIARARAGGASAFDRRLDAAAIACATGFPLLHWHAHLPRRFHWLLPGDFFSGTMVRGVATELLGPAITVSVGVAVLYVVRAAQLARSGRTMFAKHLVVVTTALVWWVGIVGANDDFTFTVTNVTLHGVPYVALLWFHSRARSADRPEGLVARVVAGGFGAFLAVALAFAFVEEFAWDRLVWNDRPWWFGDGEPISPNWHAAIVPLLALPQAVHYLLDGVLWRRRDTGRAQAKALGFA